MKREIKAGKKTYIEIQRKMIETEKGRERKNCLTEGQMQQKRETWRKIERNVDKVRQRDR